MIKIVKLCREGSCCPEVRIADDHIEIGENDNVCILTTGEFEILKEKILNKEV